jgi:hypothetical protein
MSIATASDFEIAPAPARPLLVPLVSAAACVALADWLFWGWTMIGVSLALFLGVLGVVAVSINRTRAPRNTQIVMSAVFVAGLLAVIEDSNGLSQTVAELATALFVIVTTAHQASSWQRDLLEAVTIPFRGPFQLIGDLFGALRHMTRRTPGWLGWLVAWIVPLSVFAVFLALFSSANPLIENRLMWIDLRTLFNLIDSWRMAFWVLIACVIWPLIRQRTRRKSARESESRSAAAAEPSDLDYLLGVQAVSRSLILFNALFAVQSALDLTYLWGGASLPDGMSHAEYAHRGAYPLIATALLAAGFVLIAMRPGGPAEHSRLIRPLVLVWTGQNILLVVSSIFRLDLYVAAFSLTYLRLAALIWMLLVGIGLALMVMQIVRGKSNSWLLAANAISLALVLYGCCFINAPWLVASYNVEHSLEIAGTGPNLDLQYLGSLGPQAEPALRPHVKQMPQLQSVIYTCRHVYYSPSSGNWYYSPSSGNWRAWSFRAWRLQRYLSNNPDTSPNPPDNSGKG